ncbi:MAG: DNA translocase FtsK 4TM domain-containing protein, partial [Clostridia bacterium]|nr:DNA translocase FtsK 4TM domain-containing protein [Clostridia bacterium]
MVEEKKKRGRPQGTKNKPKAKEAPKANVAGSRLKDEIWAIIILALGVFLVVSLQTEAAGELGIIISKLLKGCFGIIAYVLPYYLIVYGLLLFAKGTAHIGGRSVLFLFLIFLMLTLLNSARYLGADAGYHFSFKFIGQMFLTGINLETGGAFGMVIGYLIVKTLGMPGLYILSIVTIVISLMLVINTPVSQFLDSTKAKREARKLANLENQGASNVVVTGEQTVQ